MIIFNTKWKYTNLLYDYLHSVELIISIWYLKIQCLVEGKYRKETQLIKYKVLQSTYFVHK